MRQDVWLGIKQCILCHLNDIMLCSSQYTEQSITD